MLLVTRPDGVTVARADAGVPVHVALLELAALAGDRRTVAVIGGVGPPGPTPGQLQAHRDIGYAVARLEIDVLIAVGGVLAAETARTARGRSRRRQLTFYLRTPADARQALIDLLRPGDLVFVHGGELDELAAELARGAGRPQDS